MKEKNSDQLFIKLVEKLEAVKLSMGGISQKTELPSGGQAPYSTGFPC